MQDNCKRIIKGLTSTCREVLGLKKNYKKWIAVDRIQEIKNKNTASNSNRKRTETVKAQAEYTEANKQVEELAEKFAREGTM
ncbi:unnamed protein product [Schistosoma margrebowiei]|uniref:Uncharacterized protein n=1 Tax=Schistosoma margrebowiei TaxID=48269 RepID=A0A183ME66_9TREM|nr:unnamed protein product [Schistosoma margrebowiei]